MLEANFWIRYNGTVAAAGCAATADAAAIILFGSVGLKLASKNFDLLILWHQSAEVNTSHSNRIENRRTKRVHTLAHSFDFVSVNLVCAVNQITYSSLTMIRRICFGNLSSPFISYAQRKMHQFGRTMDI